MSLPKVTIACPTASAKNYALKDYLASLMNLKYPNFNIRMFCNTMDNGYNAKHVNKTFAEMFGRDDDKFLCQNSMVLNGLKRDSIQSVIDRMVISHNDCRNAVLNSDSEWLLHAESDIFIPPDTIERLMSHAKRFVGAPYYTDNGQARRLVFQRRVFRSQYNIVSENFFAEDDAVFLDGSLKEVSHAGLGCVLIHRDVLEKIKFRAVKGQGVHPDSYFAEDCFNNGIKIYVDTSVICEHRNQAWGIYGIDFK